MVHVLEQGNGNSARRPQCLTGRGQGKWLWHLGQEVGCPQSSVGAQHDPAGEHQNDVGGRGRVELPGPDPGRSQLSGLGGVERGGVEKGQQRR